MYTEYSYNLTNLYIVKTKEVWLFFLKKKLILSLLKEDNINHNW